MSNFQIYPLSRDTIDVLKDLGIGDEQTASGGELAVPPVSFLLGGDPQGAGSTIYISPDGALWSPSIDDPFSAGFCFGIASSDKIIVAVGGKSDGTGKTISYSSNGYNWKKIGTDPFAGGYAYGVCWSPKLGMFVAVGKNSTTTGTVFVAYSMDGITWVVGAQPFSNGSVGYCVCWSPELEMFVMGGNNPGGLQNLFYSYDGKTWSASTNRPFQYCYGVCWSPKLAIFVLVGVNNDASQTISYSTDGKLWSYSTNNLFSGGVGNGVAWSPERGIFVAVGNNQADTISVIYSPDAKVWTNTDGTVFNGGVTKGVCWGGDRFIIVGENPPDSDIQTSASFDGINWYESPGQPMSLGLGAAITSTTIPIPVRGPPGPAVKTFVIDHPLDPVNKHLIHACIEGPEQGVYYRGTAMTFSRNSVEITLPNYTKKIVDHFTVVLTPKILSKSDLNDFPCLRSSPVIDGKFTVYSNKPLCEFDWLVMGTRNHLDVVVDKTKVAVKGDGPYKYL